MNYAHIKINKGSLKRQTLIEHNRNVCRIAAECLETVNLKNLGMLAGLLHDGKGTEKFQDYLKRSVEYDGYEMGYFQKPDFDKPVRGSVNHTFAGVIYMLEKYHKGDTAQKLTAEIISLAIGSHHGLFDCEDIGRTSNGFTHMIKADRDSIQYKQAEYSFEHEISSVDELDCLFEKAVYEVTSFSQKINQYIEKYKLNNSQGDRKLFIKDFNMYLCITARLVISALIYADRRDTAEFYDDCNYDDIKGGWDRDIKEFEYRYGLFGKSKAGINAVREDISEQCVAFADRPTGIYRMDVPTGGGKTLASLRYALYHAKKHDKKKIIYVIPLLTIIEQNASVIRQYLPYENILEHHSDVVREDMTSTELSEYDLCRDRWSSPVIITTLVEMLNILFGDRTSDVSRLRALCDSVIIFDEVQSVPKNMLAMFNSALNYLSGFCNTTIILCSATQPEFGSIRHFPLNISENRMVSLSKEQLGYFKRYRYHDLTEHDMSTKDLSDFAIKTAEDKNPLMIVCNTKSEAKIIYKDIRRDTIEKNDFDVMFLSAGLCKAHRKDILNIVKGRLKKIQDNNSDKKLILVTTQLVEAGVDISFRSVIRVAAGDDNLVQSAGRCDRSGEYGDGDVYLIKLKGERKKLENLPDILEAQRSLLDTMFCKGFSPEDTDFISEYYKRLYSKADADKMTYYSFKGGFMADLMSRLMIGNLTANDPYLIQYPFKTCSEEFKVFPEDTYTVLVPYKNGDTDGKKLIEQIEEYKGDYLPRKFINRSSMFTINIYEWQMEKLKSEGLIKAVYKDLIYAVDEKAYSSTGLII